jgi:hypothetical protein
MTRERNVSLPPGQEAKSMSNELLGEWLTYASFAIPGMLCFVGAIWDEWRDTQMRTVKEAIGHTPPAIDES